MENIKCSTLEATQLTGNGLNSAWTKEFSQESTPAVVDLTGCMDCEESTWHPTMEKSWKISTTEMTELKRQTNTIIRETNRLMAIISVIEEDNME